jgi:RND family efflux transporter MFP subunit
MLVYGLFAEQIYATFDVVAKKEATLSLDISGIVKKIYFDVGSSVKAGDLILELENETQKNDLELAIKDEKIAEINYLRSKSNFERYEKVKNVIDEFRLDGFKFDMLSAEAAWQKAKTNIQIKKTVLAKTYLKAPFSGIISVKHVEVGDGVSSGTLTPVADLIGSSGRKLILSFDEKYHRVVKAGSTFVYKIDGNQQTFTGKITKVYPSIDPKTRMAKAEVATNTIKPGLFGDGYIEVK